jgi:hypothetical protein
VRLDFGKQPRKNRIETLLIGGEVCFRVDDLFCRLENRGERI